MAKKQQKSQSKEIIWNIINSLLAGGLVLLGSFANGFSWKGLGFALTASGIVAITKFKDYWSKEEGEYSSKLFNFIK